MFGNPRRNTKIWKDELSFEEGCDIADGFREISGLLERLDNFLAAIPGLGAAGIADLRLVCDEIGSNVVRHSSPASPVRLDVDVTVRNDIVRLRLTDNGGEFNPFAQVIPYLGGDLDQRRAGGLGLYLIQQLFPLATYQRVDGKNISEVEYHMGKDGDEKMQRGRDASVPSNP